MTNANAAATVARMTVKLAPWIALTRFDKPVGTWLVLWPAWWGALAAGTPDAMTMILLALGALLMRSAGCVINDMTDRDLDRHVARTATRPLAAGTLTLRQAMIGLLVLLIAAAAICWALNPKLFMLAVPVLVLIILYPRMKRITWWPQAFLGLTFNMGVWFGWFAMTDTFSLVPALLYLAAIAWTIGYDTIYAHQDIEDDLRIGIKSTAIHFGRWNRLAIGACYLLTASIFAATGVITSAHSLFWPAWLAAICLLFTQTVTFVPRDAGKALFLFKINPWVGFFFALAITFSG